MDKYEWMSTTLDGKVVSACVAVSAIWFELILISVLLKFVGVI